MATVRALRDTLAAALGAITDTGAKYAAGATSSTCGVIDPPPPLPGLHVDGVGVIPMPVPHSTKDKLQQAGNVSDCDTSRHISAERISLTPEWTTTIETTARDQLKRLLVVGVPLRVAMYELIVVAPYAMYQLEEAPAAFATMLIQLPGSGGALACTSSSGERALHNLAEKCQSSFYAVTCLNGGSVSGASTDKYRVFLRYDLYCDDEGPAPTASNAGRPQWLLKRAAHTWHQCRRMKRLKNVDVTPEKLAILLEQENEPRFSELQGDDLAIVQALRESNLFSLRLVLTSKKGATPTGCWQSHVSTDARAKSSFSSILWVGEDDTELKGFRLSISDGDALANDGNPSAECWERRTLLIFWPKSEDALMACKADVSYAIGIAAKAVRSELSADRDLLQTVLESWMDNPPDPQSVVQLLNIVVQGGDSDSTQRVLALMVARDSDSEEEYIYGLATGEHVLALHDAVREFGWSAVKDGVLAVVNSTDDLHNVVELAKSLHDRPGDYTAPMAIFRSLLARVHERGSIPADCTEYIMRLLFTDTNLTKERTAITLAISSSFAKLKCDLAVVVESVLKTGFVSDKKALNDRQAIVLAYFSKLGTKSDGFVSAALTSVDLFGWSNMRGTLLTAVESSFGQASTFCRAARLCMELYEQESTKNAGLEMSSKMLMKIGNHAPFLDIVDEVSEELFRIVQTFPGMNDEKRKLYMGMAAKGSPRLASWTKASLDTTRRVNELSTESLLDGLLPHIISPKDLEPSTPSAERFALARRIWEVLLEAPNASTHQSRFVSNALTHPALLITLLNAQFRRFHPNPELERVAVALRDQLSSNSHPWITSLTSHLRNVYLQILKFFLQEPPVEAPSSPEVVIVENTTCTPVPQPTPRRPANRRNGQPPLPTDDEIEEITVLKKGTDANIDLPHMRRNCGVFPWTQGSADNKRVCARCFCYVCDTFALQCDKWDEHCQADERSDYWKQMRDKAKPQPPAPKRRRQTATRGRGRGRRRSRSSR